MVIDRLMLPNMTAEILWILLFICLTANDVCANNKTRFVISNLTTMSDKSIMDSTEHQSYSLYSIIILNHIPYSLGNKKLLMIYYKLVLWILGPSY